MLIAIPPKASMLMPPLCESKSVSTVTEVTKKSARLSVLIIFIIDEESLTDCLFKMKNNKSFTAAVAKSSKKYFTLNHTGAGYISLSALL